MPDTGPFAAEDAAWKAYLIALAAGMLAGAIVGLIKARSPAPPIIGLAGRFSIPVGE